MQMILQHGDIYCDVEKHLFYEINENGCIKCISHDSILFEPRFVEYHGRVYTSLSANDGTHYTVYPLDELVAYSFLNDMIDKFSYVGHDGTKHFKIIHRDGDVTNCRSDNLQIKPFLEEWRPITFPGVSPNTYAVSNFGNVSNLVKGFICKKHQGLSTPNGKPYMRVSLYSTDNKFHEYRIHRLVVREFLDKRFPDKYDSEIEVNHIDGHVYNNQIDNLEICNPKENQAHAQLLKLANNCGSSNSGSKLSDQTVEKICELLVKYNGNCSKVIKEMDNCDGMTLSNISKIKRKERWKHISDKYFNKNDLANMVCGETHYNAKMSEKLVRHICELLVNFDGCIHEVVYTLRAEKVFNVSNDDISDIKIKQRWVRVSNEYFDYHDRQFIPK